MTTQVLDLQPEELVLAESKAVRREEETRQEHLSQWQRLLDWSKQLKFRDLWRPWLGLAFLVDGETEGLVANEQVRVVTLYDLPFNHMKRHRQREFVCLMERPMRLHFNMPQISSAHAKLYDLRCQPTRRPDGHYEDDALLPEMDPRLFKTGHQLHLALSAAAVHYSDKYKPLRDSFYAQVLLTEPTKGERLIPLGPEHVLTGEIPHPRLFMPRAYLPFRKSPELLFKDLLVTAHGGAHLSPTLIGRFLDDLGGGVGHAPPPRRWRNQPLEQRWRSVRANFGPEMLPALETWFCGTAVEENGVYWLPADLVAPIAKKRATLNQLRWDFAPTREYWQPGVHGFVCPPIRRKFSRHMSGFLPGEIAFDLVPLDARYVHPR